MGLTNSDLRIRNLVNYNGQVHQVSDILSNESVVLNGIDESLKTDEIEGFLIDESILMKLGAKHAPHKGTQKYRIEIKDFLTFYFCINEGKVSSSYLLVTQDPEKEARFNYPIRFIHELQNLFSLFNKRELDINVLISEDI